MGQRDRKPFHFKPVPSREPHRCEPEYWERTKRRFHLTQLRRSLVSLLVELLHQHGIALSVVNPRQVRDFAKGIGIDAKTDRIDAAVLIRIAEVVCPAPQAAQTDERAKPGALVERRRQLVDLIHST